MLKPRSDFWIERTRREIEYQRETFTATVTNRYDDATYDVEVSYGLSSGARYYDCKNASAYTFSVGQMVVVARVGGARGNRHIILGPAGRGTMAPAPPSGGGGTGGGSSGGSASLSEVVAARDSDTYGPFSTLDARLEAGDGEVKDARQGYASLSERIASKADLSSPQFEGVPRAEKIEVHDGARYITWADESLTFTDGVAGTKTLSELAAGGGGAPHNLLDGATHPDTLSASVQRGDLVVGNATPKWAQLAIGSSGRTLTVVGGDLKWACSPEALCDQMLDLVLRNQLDTKSPIKFYVIYKTTSEADANNGMVTWSGTWSQTTEKRYTTAGGAYFEFTFIGDQITLWANTAHTPSGTGTHTVLLDGTSQANWVQPAPGYYQLTGLSYGVHTIRVTIGGSELDIGHLIPHQLPYQGLGVAGDACEVLHYSPWLYATTIGVSTTNNGGAYPSGSYGEAISPRLPLSTNYGNDRVLLRNPLNTGLAPATWGLVRLPVEFPDTWVSGGIAYDLGTYPVTGETITLGSGGATRGCRPVQPIVHIAHARDLSSAVIHCTFLPFIARITAIGAGSALSVGQIVFGIAWYGATSAEVRNITPFGNGADYATDFYKIPASLL